MSIIVLEFELIPVSVMCKVHMQTYCNVDCHEWMNKIIQTLLLIELDSSSSPLFPLQFQILVLESLSLFFSSIPFPLFLFMFIQVLSKMNYVYVFCSLLTSNPYLTLVYFAVSFIFSTPFQILMQPFNGQVLSIKKCCKKVIMVTLG